MARPHGLQPIPRDVLMRELRDVLMQDGLILIQTL